MSEVACYNLYPKPFGAKILRAAVRFMLSYTGLVREGMSTRQNPGYDAKTLVYMCGNKNYTQLRVCPIPSPGKLITPSEPVTVGSAESLFRLHAPRGQDSEVTKIKTPKKNAFQITKSISLMDAM